MAGRKTFVNKTNSDLYVTLYVRNGANPDDGNAGDVSFIVNANSSHTQSYGNDHNVYLNAIRFSWDDAGARLVKEQEVVTRGCWWDDVMNTNSIITFNNVGRADITGSN
ncbi:MAG: hypothetical protein AB8G11_13305 [Saprospiraceae bacterium]